MNALLATWWDQLSLLFEIVVPLFIRIQESDFNFRSIARRHHSTSTRGRFVAQAERRIGCESHVKTTQVLGKLLFSLSFHIC